MDNGTLSLDERLDKMEGNEARILIAIQELKELVVAHSTMLGILKWALGAIWTGILLSVGWMLGKA